MFFWIGQTDCSPEMPSPPHRNVWALRLHRQGPLQQPPCSPCMHLFSCTGGPAYTLGRVPHCCKLLTHMQPLFFNMLILPLTSFLCFIIDRDISSSIVLWSMLVSVGPLLDVLVDSYDMQWRCFTTSSKLNGVPARSSSWKFKHRTKALTLNAAC